MNDAPDASPPKPPQRNTAATRKEARLKVALKANMARRKSQAKLRAETEQSSGSSTSDPTHKDE